LIINPRGTIIQLFVEMRDSMIDTNFDVIKILSAGAKALGAGAEEESRWEIPTDHPDPIDLAVGMPVPEGIPMASLANHISKVLSSGRYMEMEYE